MTRRPAQHRSWRRHAMRGVRFAALVTAQILGGLLMSDVALAVKLDAQVMRQSEQDIEVQYVLVNSTPGRILLFDQLLSFDAKGAIRLAQYGAYVFRDGEKSARLVIGLVAPPMFMSVARRPPIVVSILEPGATRTAAIKLSLPLAEFNPYFPVQACDPKQAKPVIRLQVQLGWVEQRSGMSLGKVVVEGKEFDRLSGGWGSPLQRVAMAEVAVHGVGLCEYAGQFDRPELQK